MRRRACFCRGRKTLVEEPVDKLQRLPVAPFFPPIWMSKDPQKPPCSMVGPVLSRPLVGSSPSTDAPVETSETPSCQKHPYLNLQS